MTTPITTIGLFNIGCASAGASGARIAAHLVQQGLNVTTDLGAADQVLLTGCGCCGTAISLAESTIQTAGFAYPELIVSGLPDGIATVLSPAASGAVFINGDNADDRTVQHFLGTSTAPSAGPCSPVRLTNAPYAMVSLHQGYDFCTLPAPADAPVQRSIDDILKQARHLTDLGIQELVLIDHSPQAADTAYLTEIVTALARLGIWVRLQALHPEQNIEPLLPLMADGLVLPYLDFRFLHVSPPLQDVFGLTYPADGMLEKFDTWRQACPGLQIRGSFIVGHALERDQDFEMLLSWLDKAQLGRISATPWDGLAADDQLTRHTDIVRRRTETLMAHQAGISARQQTDLIGRILTVLVDEVDEEGTIARCYRDGVGIDGCVFLNGETELDVGDMVEVEIEHADEYDLWGQVYD